MKLNGALTAGENIADIGGVKLAFAAYRALRAVGADTIVADGFTEDQQFFLGVRPGVVREGAPRVRAAARDASTRTRRRSGASTAALAATPDFAKAFSCKPGAKLRPKNACTVW